VHLRDPRHFETLRYSGDSTCVYSLRLSIQIRSGSSSSDNVWVESQCAVEPGGEDSCPRLALIKNAGITSDPVHHVRAIHSRQ
jgi:hypothetical protein